MFLRVLVPVHPGFPAVKRLLLLYIVICTVLGTACHTGNCVMCRVAGHPLLLLCIISTVLGTVCHVQNGGQGSHASWKVLVFILKIPGPGKSWKITLVLESPGN